MLINLPVVTATPSVCFSIVNAVSYEVSRAQVGYSQLRNLCSASHSSGMEHQIVPLFNMLAGAKDLVFC